MTAHPVVAALKACRERRHWTQDDLARKLGVGQAAISGCERGHRNPSFDLINRWAAMFGRTLQLSNPADQRPRVIIDPAQRWGQPQVQGISVEVLVEKVRAEKSVDVVADEYGLTRGDVLVACWWAGLHGSRRDRADWGTWAEQAGQAMWHASTCDYSQIPDPPTGGDT